MNAMTMNTAIATGAAYLPIASFRSRIAEARLYQQTRRELEALSDRDLADIGISRFDIRAVAREHVAMAAGGRA